jgi:hypothetical protein
MRELGGRNPLRTERAALTRHTGRAPPKRKIRFYLSSGAAVCPVSCPQIWRAHHGVLVAPCSHTIGKDCGGTPRAVGTMRRVGVHMTRTWVPPHIQHHHQPPALPLSLITCHHHHCHHHKCGLSLTTPKPAVETSHDVILSA